MIDSYRQAYSINCGEHRQITMKLSPDLWARLDKAAKARDLARSVMVRRLIEGALENPALCDQLLQRKRSESFG